MDGLTVIDGIGKASARALAEAGIGDIAALAALDPDTPPEVPGLRGPEWTSWVDQARALVAAPVTDPSPVLHAGATASLRAATVASRIEHDGETYAPDDLIVLTEAEFGPLAMAGALVEASWDDCVQDEGSPG